MPTVHVVLGTKAQYIKMAPVILACKTQGMDVHLIDTGQHAATTLELRRIFSLPEPKMLVPGRSQDVARLSEGPFWLWRIILALGHGWERIFEKKRGPVLVHGDTASTLIGAIMGRQAGLPVVHIESGLRSWSWWHPFPEEIIRLLTMRISDWLVAPSEQSRQNIERMGLSSKCVFIPGNTVEDALEMTWKPEAPQQARILACIHRMETLQIKGRLTAILDNIIKLKEAGWQVTFVQHPATEKAIARIGYRDKLSAAGVQLLPIQPYDVFLKLMGSAEVVIADGGSIQEECALLGKWCLVPRKATERQDGLGHCVHLVDCDWRLWQQALERKPQHVAIQRDTPNRPSMRIAHWLATTFST